MGCAQSANLASPEEVDITTDVIYKDATDMTCPVCGKPYSELTHAVPWSPYGGQKIFACSAEHAQLIYSDPVRVRRPLVERHGP